MTLAPNAISRIDDGVATPDDRVIAAVFDRHMQATAFQPHDFAPAGFCLVCGERTEDGAECLSCHLAEEIRVDRSRDL